MSDSTDNRANSANGSGTFRANVPASPDFPPAQLTDEQRRMVWLLAKHPNYWTWQRDGAVCVRTIVTYPDGRSGETCDAAYTYAQLRDLLGY